MSSDASSAPVSAASLIGIDWGTSSLRAFLIGDHGEVLDRLHTPEGIMQVTDGDFEGVLSRLLNSWVKPDSDHDGDNTALPLLASGMITSRNGWIETPYLPVPTGAAQLADALESVPAGFGNNKSFSNNKSGGKSLHFVTGVTVDHGGAPDVIRGEETQITGVVESGMVDGICVLPGTHSKWVTVRDGRIVNFETIMSGEVFEALKSHTILGKLITDGSFSEDGFRLGVAAGLEAGPRLLHSLFHVRTLPLFKKLDETKVSDYLSGMLIGAEIQGVLSNRAIDDPITIMGRNDLADRYAMALQVSGLQSTRAPEDIAALGYFAIAKAARLLS